MIHATFCIVKRGEEKYRLYVFADVSARGLAQKIADFLGGQFDVTLKYFSAVSGKSLTRDTPNLGAELERAHAQTRFFTDLLAKLANSSSHFSKEDFEGSVEFFNGKTSLWLRFDQYADDLPGFLDAADLFLFSQGLWDELPKDFLDLREEEKAFDVVSAIITRWNNRQAD